MLPVVIAICGAALLVLLIVMFILSRIKVAGPNEAFIEGRALNVLISAEAAPPNGGAAFHDTAVWLRPETAAAPAAHRQQELMPA